MDGDLLGREAESAAISAFLERLRSGPGVLVLSGEPGIGKTTLWRRALHQGHELGFQVLSTRPVAAEAKLAFSGLTDLLGSVAEEVLDSLVDPQRQALAAATLRQTPGRRQCDPRAVTAAAMNVLRRLAQHSPVLLAVDDLHWADPETARTLESVVRRLSDERIGLVVSERADGSPTRSVDLEQAIAPDRFERVVVAAMEDQALRRLVERRLGAAPPLRAHRRLQEVAGGNPFFTLELARALSAEGATGVTALPMPPSLSGMVDERLASLSDCARSVLVAAAATENPNVELVATGAGFGAADALLALEEAAGAGIVELDTRTRSVRFVHPLYAAGIYARTSPRRRRQVHLALAQMMTNIELQARHLALGQIEPDSELAQLLDRAAQHARARGAPDSAAVLAIQALRLTPAPEITDCHRRIVTVARFRFHAGELEQARRMLQSLLGEAVDSSTRAAAGCLLGEISYHQQGVGDAQELFAAAAAEASPDPEVACRIEMHLAYLSVNTDRFDHARLHAQRGLSLSAWVEDVGLRAESLAVAVIADYMIGRGLDEPRLAESLALEDPFHQVAMALRPSFIAGMLMLYEGRLAEAVAFFESCHGAAVDRAEEIDTALVLATLAWTECWRGRLDAAQNHGHRTIEVCRRLALPGSEGIATAYLSAVEAYRGDEDASRAHAARAFELAEQTGSALADMWARWGLGLLALGRDDPAATHAVLEPMVALLEAQGLTEPVRAIYLTDQIEALVGMGELEHAERLIDLLEECATRLGRAWAISGALRCRALLAAAQGDLEAASKWSAAAREWCAGLELRLEVARTLLVSGRIERRRKHKREAARMLTEALALFDEAGAAPWAQRARDELARVAPHRAADPMLTPTEQQVAELSASGLTNRVVAARLNISPKTVEANLARVYRKLDIHGRAQLGSALLGGDSTAARHQPT